MGQTAQAILYGGIIPGLYAEGGLWQQWDEAPVADRPEHAPTRAEDDDAPAGFEVAVGRSGRDGLPHLTSVAFDDVWSVEPYASACAAAVSRWQAFATWAHGRGFAMPSPGLWVTEASVR